MARVAPSRTKINTEVTQLASRQPSRRSPGRVQPGRPARQPARVGGDARGSVRDPSRQVVEMDCGITVYPPEMEGEPWRAVFTENGQRRYRQAATEARLAAKLEKVRERLEADAPNLERPGADLITYYLDPDRLPPDRCWSRKHAHTQRRLCERFAAPAIGIVTCQDIRPWHMQQIVNAAPTAGEGARVVGMISALVSAGITGGYLANPRLKEVHWQAAGRTLPVPKVTTAGESALWVYPSDIPAAGDVERLGQALAAGRHRREHSTACAGDADQFREAGRPTVR